MSKQRVEETRGRVRVVSEGLTDGSRVYDVEIQVAEGEDGAGEWLLFAHAVSEQHAYMAMDCAATGLAVAQGERTNVDRQGVRS